MLMISQQKPIAAWLLGLGSALASVLDFKVVTTNEVSSFPY